MKAIFFTKDGLESKMQEIPGNIYNPPPFYTRPLEAPIEPFMFENEYLPYINIPKREYEFFRTEIIANTVEVALYKEI
jgi:hypothetical protein